MAGSSRGPGRPIEACRWAWMLRLGLRYKKPSRNLPDAILAQLSYCRSDEARRIILGISK
jgi:hypothetical protein